MNPNEWPPWALNQFVASSLVGRDLRLEEAEGIVAKPDFTATVLDHLALLSSPLKKASLTGFHATAKHIAAKAVSPSSETMRTI